MMHCGHKLGISRAFFLLRFFGVVIILRLAKIAAASKANLAIQRDLIIFPPVASSAVHFSVSLRLQ
jgi:hypothetical protein